MSIARFNLTSEGLVVDERGRAYPRERVVSTALEILSTYMDISQGQIDQHNHDAGLQTAKVIPSAAVATRRPEPGFVYLMSNGTRWKIGRAKNVESRLRQLRIQSGMDIELLASGEFADYKAMELHLHRKYAALRSAGEWFALSPEDVQSICEVLAS